MPRFEPGFSAANIEGVAAYLQKLGYSGPLAFGWDDTELQQGVTVMQRTSEFCVVVGGAGGPVEVRNEGDIESMLRALDPQTKLATKVHVSSLFYMPNAHSLYCRCVHGLSLFP